MKTLVLNISDVQNLIKVTPSINYQNCYEFLIISGYIIYIRYFPLPNTYNKYIIYLMYYIKYLIYRKYVYNIYSKYFYTHRYKI